MAIIINEHLCYLQNYFGKVPKSLLCATLSSFYMEDEIVDAKSELFAQIESLNNMPRLKLRKAREANRKLDTEDIVGLYEILDRDMVSLPSYVSKNINRLPNVSPSDVDLFKLTDSMQQMKSQMDGMKLILANLTQSQSTASEVMKVLLDTRIGVDANIHTSVTPAVSQPVVSTITTVDDHKGDIMTEVTSDSDILKHNHKTFAEMLHVKDDNGEWFPVTRSKKPSQNMIRKIIGTSASVSQKVKAVPESVKSWHIFVGRMSPDTAEEDVKELLCGTGISVLDCKMLKKTEEWHKKFSAFHVTVKYDDKDAVFNECIWPAGSDVRDWWFK